MKTRVQELLERLVEVQPLDEPLGEAGVTHLDADGVTRTCAPVISVYLDMTVREVGTRPALRPGTVILRDRLREIERTFWPRGLAYDSVLADAARIEQYLTTHVSPSARGVAVFASAQHQLFEALETLVPFENDVSVRAEPSLFQLTRLLDDQETAVVAVVALNVARLFVVRAGQLIQVEHRTDDPKLFHKVRGTNAMNQKRYQRHAQLTREEFAHEVAGRVEQLVRREGASRVVVAGEMEAIALLRKALPPAIGRLVSERSPRMDVHTPLSAIEATIDPVLIDAEHEDDLTAIDQLLEGVQAGDLGVAGPAVTRAALEAGQVDLLLLSSTAAFPAETRSGLIELAQRSGARVEIVDGSAALDELGGCGAVLRYRIAGLDRTAARAHPPA